jgi:hypothetical protein
LWASCRGLLELFRELLESDIRSVVYELPRIPVPRTLVNKGMKKGQEP